MIQLIINLMILNNEYQQNNNPRIFIKLSKIQKFIQKEHPQ